MRNSTQYFFNVIRKMWNLHISHTSIVHYVGSLSVSAVLFILGLVLLPCPSLHLLFALFLLTYVCIALYSHCKSIPLPLVTYSEKFTLCTLLSLIPHFSHSCCIFIILCTGVIAPSRCVYHINKTNNNNTILFRTELQLNMNISVLTTSDQHSSSDILLSR